MSQESITTGYEHVPTEELPKIWAHLKTVRPQDAQHASELLEDMDLLNVEIAKRV